MRRTELLAHLERLEQDGEGLTVAVPEFCRKMKRLVTALDLETSGSLSIDATMNTKAVAEYLGLIAGLEALENVTEPVEVRGDSRLVINQVTRRWACRAQNLRPLLARVRELIRPSMTFRWIPREQNEDADEMSRVAFSEGCYMPEKGGDDGCA